MQLTSIPIYKGRKINRMLCILFLVLFTISLVSAVLVSDITVIFAQITGAFALLYGILWAFWARKESKAEQALKDRTKLMDAPEEPDGFSQAEYLLPKERLTGAALQRFRSILKGATIAALVVFALITGSMLWKGTFGGFTHALGILFFSTVITLPGIIVQGIIYFRYQKTVPRKICLYPGEMVIDERTFYARDIRDVRISPNRIYNANSPSVFREMTLRTAQGEKRCLIDFRAASPGQGICWEQYPQFAEDLSKWGLANGVEVTVAYMD